jgi:hypothetical protein
MNCAYHADRLVQGVCSTCGRPVCEECLVNLNGNVYCRPCLEARVGRPGRDIRGGARFILSIVPGLGHLYMGLFQRGFQFLVGTVLGAFIIGMLFAPMIGFWIPGMIFFSIFDAREVHLRIAQGLEVEDKGIVDTRTWRFDWNNRYVGYALVAIGALALYNSLVEDALRVFLDPNVYYQVARAIRGVTMGVLAIGAGLWLLRRNLGDSSR